MCLCETSLSLLSHSSHLCICCVYITYYIWTFSLCTPLQIDTCLTHPSPCPPLPLAPTPPCLPCPLPCPLASGVDGTWMVNCFEQTFGQLGMEGESIHPLRFAPSYPPSLSPSSSSGLAFDCDPGVLLLSSSLAMSHYSCILVVCHGDIFGTVGQDMPGLVLGSLSSSPLFCLSPVFIPCHAMPVPPLLPPLLPCFLHALPPQKRKEGGGGIHTGRPPFQTEL